MSIRISGRAATVNVGRGNIELAPNRKLSITNGVFEVPDTHPKPSPARTRFRAEGSADAAAELLSLERLRWLPELAPGPVIAVNIPSFRLWAFANARRDGIQERRT